MHSPFRHTTLPQTTTSLSLAAQGHDLTDDWSLPSAHFVDSWCPFQCSFGCVLLLNQMFWKQNVPFNNTTPIYLINYATFPYICECTPSRSPGYAYARKRDKRVHRRGHSPQAPLEGRLLAAGTQLPMIAGSSTATLPPESTVGLSISMLIAGKCFAWVRYAAMIYRVRWKAVLKRVFSMPCNLERLFQVSH